MFKTTLPCPKVETKPNGFLATVAHVVKKNLGYKISSVSCIARLYSSGLRERSRHMACRRNVTFHGTLKLIPAGRNFDSTDICFNMYWSTTATNTAIITCRYNKYRVFPGGKAVGAWCLSLTSFYCLLTNGLGLYLHLPCRLHHQYRCKCDGRQSLLPTLTPTLTLASTKRSEEY